MFTETPLQNVEKLKFPRQNHFSQYFLSFETVIVFQDLKKNSKLRTAKDLRNTIILLNKKGFSSDNLQLFKIIDLAL
jgi:hypothetical protein